MASTKERAWLAAHQKGSKALIQKLDKAHANNPEYQAFKKKHGLGDTSSVKQVSKSQVDVKKEKARQALSAKAYGATKGTRMGGEDGRGEEIRDTTVPLSPEQHSKVKSAERAAKPMKEKKPKKTAEKKPVDRMALLKQIASKKKINVPPVSAKQLRTIAAVGNQDHDHGGWDDLAGTGFEGRGGRNIDEEVEQVNEVKMGIGTVVKLKKPINGHGYATVKGFTSSGSTRGPTGRGVPMPAGNVKKVKVALRKSDDHSYYPGPVVNIHHDDVHSVVRESYEKAEMHKDKASKALETSDIEAYHKHMASHHEELGKWHESKGRNDAAQKHFDKAEQHHEKGVKTATTLKGSRQVKEGILSKLLGKKPTQKPKLTAAQQSTGYKGLPAEWSQEKRGNEYDANKHMTGVKEEMKVNKDAPFEGPYRKKSAMTTDKSGAKHTGTSRARDLARQALKKMMKEGYMKQTVSNDDSGMSDYEHYMQTKGKKRQVEPPPSAMPSDTRLKPLPKAKKGVRLGSFNKFGNYTPGMKEEVKPDATNAMSNTLKKKHISDKDKATLGKIHALLKAQKKSK